MVTFQDWLTALERLAVDLDADHITATNSGHDIEAYNPTIVSDAIRTVVDDVRLATTTNTDATAVTDTMSAVPSNGVGFELSE